MKKIIIYSFTLICAVAIGLGVYSNQSRLSISGLIRQNIELLALVKGGGEGNLDCYWKQVTCSACNASLEVCMYYGDGHNCDTCGGSTRPCNCKD